jgi:hypothetical protein
MSFGFLQPKVIHNVYVCGKSWDKNSTFVREQSKTHVKPHWSTRMQDGCEGSHQSPGSAEEAAGAGDARCICT